MFDGKRVQFFAWILDATLGTNWRLVVGCGGRLEAYKYITSCSDFVSLLPEVTKGMRSVFGVW